MPSKRKGPNVSKHDPQNIVMDEQQKLKINQPFC
jgi:hypothetical protein